MLFLIILSVVSVFAVFMIVSPKAIATRLGRRYQETLKEHYECVKTVDSGGGFGGIDPGFTMAIFGVGALAGSSVPLRAKCSSSNSLLTGSRCDPRLFP